MLSGLLSHGKLSRRRLYRRNGDGVPFKLVLGQHAGLNMLVALSEVHLKLLL